MSDHETEEIPVEEEETIVEEETIKPQKVKKEKNPNRVKQGFKLAAIGQKAKEEKMRQRVKDEMIKPATWITVGAVLTSIGFIGLYFSPLFKKEEIKEYEQPLKREEKPVKSRNYFD